jgi:putative DNA primase/helicase
MPRSDGTSDVQDWVWESMIPAGKLTLLTGAPAIGKSFVLLDISAGVTHGQRGPHDEAPGEPGAVLLITGYDDLADTIGPRLESASADLTRIHVLDGIRQPDPASGQGDHGVRVPDDNRAPKAAGLAGSSGDAQPDSRNPLIRFRLDRDLAILETLVQSMEQQDRCRVRMIIIDPIRYVLTGSGDGRNKLDVEGTVLRLQELAARTRAAIVLVTCGEATWVGNKPLRTMARALEAAAQSVWMVKQDPDVRGRRLLRPIKTGLSEMPKGWAFTIDDEGIQWVPKAISTKGNGRATTAAGKQVRILPRRKDTSELARAVQWLEGELEQGPVRSLTLREAASAYCISLSTLRRAFAKLGCLAVKDGVSGSWFWRLPDSSVVEDADAQPGGTGGERRDGEGVDAPLKREDGWRSMPARWRPRPSGP